MFELHVAFVCTVALVVFSGCAPAAPGAPGAESAPTMASPKRIVAAVMFDPEALIDEDGLHTGTNGLMDLLLTPLSIVDDRGTLRPGLAEAIPSLENDRWKVFPDGRMETTWKLKPNLRWHDGTPFTADDLVFSATVHGDREVPRARDSAFNSIEAVEATDSQTVVVKWRRTYVEADQMFSMGLAMPMARHRMEGTYLNEKANFRGDPYWFDSYVGTGAFKLREAVRNSHMVLEAYDDHLFGRPKIDQIEVKFIPDSRTLMANLLAGTVELTLSRSLSIEQAMSIREQWRDGTIGVASVSWLAIYPQFYNANPPIVTNTRFRKALMHAIDRQELVDTLKFGMTSVAHSFVHPSYPDYRIVEPEVVRYAYDPQQAVRILEPLGYSRGADGGLRDASGERLGIEIRATSGGDINEKTMMAVSGYWQRIGLAMTPVPITPTMAEDRVYRANYPAFEIARQPNEVTVAALTRYHGNQARLPENNYRGSNRTRYQNPEYDALLDQFVATIPRPERAQVLAKIVNHMSDRLNIMGLFYDTEITLIGNRLTGITPNAQEMGTTVGWNGHDWDIKR
jgi:peptide/nickel transport system substrate-binding protein